MNIRDSYIHGADGKGVVKSLFFVTAADVQANNNLHLNDLGIILADANNSTFYLTIPTLNLNTTGYAALILTEKKGTNASYYLTFVDSNNNGTAAESVYTNAGLYFNPTIGPTNHVGTLYVNNVYGDNIGITIGNIFVRLGGTYTPDTSITASSTNNTIPSSKAVWDAILTGIQANDAMVFKGFLTGGNSATNTTYTPAANRGDTYKVQTAGYINGEYYQVNDTFICTTDGTVATTSSTSAADMATIKASWGVVEGNGDFLDIHGGTMYGTLSWDGTTALPTVTTASSILVVDSNTTKQISLANLLTSLNLSPSISNGTAANTIKITVGGVDSNNYTVPYATKASYLIGNSAVPSTAKEDKCLKWFTTVTATSGTTKYAGDNTGFPVSNNANGILWLGTHSGNYGGQIGISSNGYIYYRFISNNSFPNTANGGSWKRLAFTSDLLNTWRAIRVNNSSSDSVGTGTGTKAMNFTATGNLLVNYLAAGTSTGLSGSADYFTININATAWAGATSLAAGTAGYMPAASIDDRLKFLRGDGSWVALSLADHTHTLSIAANSGTNQLTLAASTRYKLTAGGSTFIFTTPPNTWIANAVDTAGYVAAPTAANNKHNVWMTDANGVPAWRVVTVPDSVPTLAWNTETSIGTVGAITFKVKLPTNPNTDSKVTQNSDNSNASYRLLFKYTANNTDETNTVKYATTLTYNPSTKLLYNNGPINVGNGSFNDLTKIFGSVSSDTLKLSAYGLPSSWTASSGNATRDFLKAWCKYIQTNYAGKVILSHINPNSLGYVQAHSYNNGFVTQANIDSGGSFTNAELGAPVHINGHYYDHGGTEHIFGYAYGCWYMYTNLHSGNSSVSGGNTITNNVATPKPGDTLTVRIGSVTKSLTIPTINSQATQLASVSKTLAVSTWTDMGAVSGLDVGTYAIQISSGNVCASGIFTACGGTDSVIDEIPLHVADKGTNTWRPYARISAGQLQMTTNETTGTARTYTIKILKLI